MHINGGPYIALSHDLAWHAPCPGGTRTTRTIMMSMKYSLETQNILLTGATGFLGSVVLEQLLRCTQAPAVYVLIRPRKGKTAQQRLEQLLKQGLFHLHWDLAAADPVHQLLQRVHAIPGDISQPLLGLQPAHQQLLLERVQVVIHCAARVQLEEHVWTNLRANYLGTGELLCLCRRMNNLQGFLHVSSAFVNINQPQQNKILEQLYPLVWQGQQRHHAQLAAELLGAGSQRRAQQLARRWCRRLNFPCTYCLGKHMAEQLVADHCSLLGCQVVIIRPSLISAIAFQPYTGYAGNFAGPASYILGYGLGFFQGRWSVAYNGSTLLDLIPADVVASLVLAAAAEAVRQQPKQQQQQQHGGRPDLVQQHLQGSDGGGELQARLPLASPLQQQVSCCSGHIGHQAVQLQCSALQVSPLELQGGSQHQHQHQHQQWQVDATCHSHHQQQQQPGPSLTIYHAASSATYPLPTHHALSIMQQFYHRNAAPVRLPLPWPSRTPRVGPNYKPRALLVVLAKGLAWGKLQLLCWGLRLAGKGRQAAAVQRAFAAWSMQNSLRYNRSLCFSVARVRQLQAKLQQQQHQVYPLLWTPEAMSWEAYGATLLAGQLSLMRGGDPNVQGVAHAFVHRPDLPPGGAKS